MGDHDDRGPGGVAVLGVQVAGGFISTKIEHCQTGDGWRWRLWHENDGTRITDGKQALIVKVEVNTNDSFRQADHVNGGSQARRQGLLLIAVRLHRCPHSAKAVTRSGQLWIDLHDRAGKLFGGQGRKHDFHFGTNPHLVQIGLVEEDF